MAINRRTRPALPHYRCCRRLSPAVCWDLFGGALLMVVKVNGEDRTLDDGQTVAGLLASLKLSSDKVAVELNRRLLRSEKYDTPLKEGDQVEIVTFVGGG